MPKKTAIKRSVIPVPQNLDEAAKFLSFIGREQRKIDKIQTTLNEKIETLKEKTADDVKSHEEKISQLVEGLFAFAQSHRDELTDSGKRKTVKVPTGSFAWRWTPLAISISDIELVVAELKSRRLKRFIRVKEEPDKKAMLKELQVVRKIPGISISQQEMFAVTPAELNLKIEYDIDTLKKAMS